MALPAYAGSELPIACGVQCDSMSAFGESAMADDGRSRLGRGLAALIGDVGEETKVVERSRSTRARRRSSS